ncbi:hypothetical protein V7183_18700 [Bacillus sp. JJ1127]|uniref:hypothetical protein n=1 Tax=Bacillus sp. JJ1127 TaxID=3122952 RepID=UPI002FFD696A
MKFEKFSPNNPLKIKCDLLLKQTQKSNYPEIPDAYSPRQISFNDTIQCHEDIKVIHHLVARIRSIIAKAVPKTSGEERFLKALESVADDLEVNTLSAQTHCERSLDTLQDCM